MLGIQCGTRSAIHMVDTPHSISSTEAHVEYSMWHKVNDPHGEYSTYHTFYGSSCWIFNVPQGQRFTWWILHISQVQRKQMLGIQCGTRSTIHMGDIPQTIYYKVNKDDKDIPLCVFQRSQPHSVRFEPLLLVYFPNRAYTLCGHAYFHHVVDIQDWSINQK